MAAADVAEEIRKRKVADALNGQGDDGDPDPEQTSSDAESSDTGDGAAAAPAPATEGGADSGDVSTAAQEAPRLGYRFVPVSPPAQDVSQNVPRETFLGEEGADVSSALTSQKVYATPPEQGDQPYVIDQDTGQKIPRAQLATSEDIAAQPPPSGAEMQRVTVEGQVPRATLVDPDPNEQYFSNPDLANKVKRAQLVDPDPDSLYLPPGAQDNPDVQRAALIGQAIKRAALVDPDPDAQYLAAANELQQPPKAQPALGYKFVPVAPEVKRAELVAKPADQPQGGDTGVANFFVKRGDQPITSANDPRLTTVTVGDQSWQVNKEAAPAFQGFLSELASKGAPVKALYSNAGWDNRPIAGTNKLSEHAYGGAIDVNQTLTGRNQVTDDFKKWMAANPGALETAEKNWNIYGGEKFGDLGHFEWGGVPLKSAQVQAQAQPVAKPAELVAAPATAKPDVTTFKNPDGSDFPARVQAVGDKDPVAFIAHHTGGRGTVQGVVDTLRQRGLGVEYVMDRDGNIFQIGQAGAQNILPGWGPKGAGLNNSNIVGMEVIAKDNNDVTDAQKASFARFMAARYPNTPIFGHGEVNPGHKEADEGQATKAAALAYRQKLASGAAPGEAAPAGAPQAQPVTKQANGLYQSEKPEDFLSGKATTFATPEDLASGADNGVGAPRLGKLDTTSVAGVAIPEEALRAKYGNNYAAWRTARADVVDPQSGKRLRVPIVDLLGATDAVVDMTPSISSYFGGNKNLMLKLVDNAGPDVTKNPQLFADEQAAIKQGFDSSTLQPGVQKIAPKLGYSFKPQSAEAAAQAQKDSAAAVQQHQDTINKLPEADSGNIIGLYKRLDQPVDGTTAQSRAAVQANLKPQIIALMRQKFPELKSDDEAWAKATSDVNPLDVGREWITKALGYGQQFINVMQKGVAGSDLLHVNQFIDQALPGASEADKHAYLTKLYAMPVEQRIAEITAKLPQPQAGIPSTDPQQIVSALDRLSDPNFQKQQATDLAKAKAEMERNVSSDPRLIGTGMEKVIDATAQLPSFLAAFSNPVLMPVAMAQVSDQVREQFKAAHPEWSEKELTDKSAYATLVQFYGQEAAMKIMTAGGGALLGGVESPAKRAIAQAITSAGGTALVGAGAQAATNIIAGEPVGKGVGEAALTGAIQGVVAGAAHGVGELRRPSVEPVRPAIEALPPEAPPAPRPRPLSAEEILGANEPAPGVPWYKPGPLVTRAAERTAFSPEELAQKVAELGSQGYSPQQLRDLVANLQPDPDFYRQQVYLSQEAQQTGLRPQAPETLVRPSAPRPGEAPETLPTGRAPVRLPVPPPERTEPMPFAPPRSVTESEPWVSQIANRFTAERILNGEIGPVVPGQGVTKEEMIARGVKMGPEQINQHVSDLMNNVGGDPKLQAAAIRTEEARLAQVSRNASLASEANPADQGLRIAADDAFKDVTDFHNGPVAKLKNNWHAQGMTLQGELPVDLSTFNGLREAFLRDVGKPAPPEMEPVMRATAQKVRNAAAAETLAMQKLGAEIDRQAARRLLPTDDQVRENIMKRMKVEPCPT